MTAGEPYEQFDPELITRRKLIREKLLTVNQLDNNDAGSDVQSRGGAILAVAPVTFAAPTDFHLEHLIPVIEKVRLDDRLLTDIGVQRSSIAEFVTAHSDRQFLINQRVAHTHNVRQIGQLQPA